MEMTPSILAVEAIPYMAEMELTNLLLKAEKEVPILPEFQLWRIIKMAPIKYYLLEALPLVI